LAQAPGWYHVQTPWGTQGWVASDLFKLTPATAASDQPPAIGSAATVGVVNLRSGPGTDFSILSSLKDSTVLEVLQLRGNWYNVRAPLGETGWVTAENVPLDWIPDVYVRSSSAGGTTSLTPATPTGQPEDAVRIAQQYIGARYVWGGSDPRGFDCSGFVWYVYQQLGANLPAGAAQQFSREYGAYISSIDQLAPGDLVFFERTTEEPGVTHVGIYAGDNKMIAARTERLGVRYVSLLDPFWSSRFVGAIRPTR
jgi:cell wall-associated NlpC family hydrolase